MKKTILSLFAAALCAGSAHAIPSLINITMEDDNWLVNPTNPVNVDSIVKNDNPAGNINSVATHETWLKNYVIPGYNNYVNNILPSLPVLVFQEGSVSTNGVPTLNLTNVTYLTYHYGGGAGGGILQAFYNDGLTGDYTPPALSPTQNGLSTVYAWGTKTTVPDSGSTLALLGLALTSLAFVTRRRK